MILLIIAGIISVIVGGVFLSGEKTVQEVNKNLTEAINKIIINTDNFFLQNREGTGICLILLGLLYFFIAYWIKVKAHVSTFSILVK